MTTSPSAPPVLAEEPATARTTFLAALQNYEAVACALDVLGATELGDAEQHVIAAFDAALLAQARQGREDAERQGVITGWVRCAACKHDHKLIDGSPQTECPYTCACPGYLQPLADVTPSPSPEGAK